MTKFELTTDHVKQITDMLPKGCIVTGGLILCLIGLAHKNPYTAEYLSAGMITRLHSFFKKKGDIKGGE